MGKTLTNKLRKRMSDPNRRMVRRVRSGLPARLWLDVGWRQVICEDVSRQGAGLRTFDEGLPLTPVESVRLTLQLPRGDAEVTGRLVHRNNGQIGIEFRDLSVNAEAQIQHALSA